MSRFWIVNLIDKTFISTAVFLIIFAWINFYIKDLWATLFLSLIFSFAIIFLLYYFLNRKHEKDNLSKQEINEMNKCILAFRLMNKTEQLNLIKKLKTKEISSGGISVLNKKLTFTDQNGIHLVIVATNITKIDDNELINLINENYNSKYDCYDIYCNETAVLNSDILKNKKIFLINKKKIFEQMKKHNLCPNTENLNPSITKYKFKDFAKAMFLPNKAKSYFLCGLILIFSSIILPHHLYYIIFGSMLLLFAIVCKILPKVAN